MDRKSKFALFVVAELAWGTLLALFLQHTRPGRYLARCRSWLAVVIGVAGTQALALPVLSFRAVLISVLAFALSSVGIIWRALLNEQRLERTLGHASYKT